VSIVKQVKEFDKMSSKYFIPFTIVVFGFVFGWTYSGGGNNFFIFHARY